MASTLSKTLARTFPPRGARLRLGAVLAVVGALAAAALNPPATVHAAPLDPPSASLTNLAHLTWLTEEVPLPEAVGHSTYRIAEEPTAIAPWTYADRNDDGSYRRVGGGTLDASTGEYSQGAYNADDIARAAVVYVRAWERDDVEDTASREMAYQLLRSLTYLQTTSGPDAGNVVLWQQADGTLNPSAEPVELPDPSDSDESYWLARTVWALGEGYAAFADSDPEFAEFLAERMRLSIRALERASLGRVGEWEFSDGMRVPGWLIADGADATAEAVLGLSAYTQARPEDKWALEALRDYANGVAAMSDPDTTRWPFGAVMPWTHSMSLWHAWGGAAPVALARASAVLDDASLGAAAVRDVGVFTPQLFTSGGPYNAWSPVPGEAQIAYGAESRLAGLLAAADGNGNPGLAELGGLAGGWFFGANPSGKPVYDPETGVTFDGVETDGRINRNSGAESTIHGQLAMLALDAHPQASALAQGITGIDSFDGLAVIEAESGQLEGATVVDPGSSWTGEANLSGGQYVRLGAGDTVTVTGVRAGDNLHPILNRAASQSGISTWYAIDESGDRTLLGRLLNGRASPQGVAENSGLLRPYGLRRSLPQDAVAVQVSTTGALEFDALMRQPKVARVTYATASGPVVLYANSTSKPVRTSAVEAGGGRSYGSDGTVWRPVTTRSIRLPGPGFAITRPPK